MRKSSEIIKESRVLQGKIKGSRYLFMIRGLLKKNHEPLQSQGVILRDLRDLDFRGKAEQNRGGGDPGAFLLGVLSWLPCRGIQQGSLNVYSHSLGQGAVQAQFISPLIINLFATFQFLEERFTDQSMLHRHAGQNLHGFVIDIHFHGQGTSMILPSFLGAIFPFSLMYSTTTSRIHRPLSL